MKYIKLVFCIIGILLLTGYSFAQAPLTVHAGPKGIFVYTGKEIPCGKEVALYKIERSIDAKYWVLIGEARTPADFPQFDMAVKKAASFFPSQPTTDKNRLQQIYKRAVSTGNMDSLRNFTLLYPFKMGLGLMFYDTTASRYAPFRYRVKAINSESKTVYIRTSDTISYPPYKQFDVIKRASSEYKEGKILVKWKSAGSNPAPLFMVWGIVEGKNIPLMKGHTSRYSVNDTSFYTFDDSIPELSGTKVFQYFVLPFDGYNNIGKASQVATISLDNFYATKFLSPNIRLGNDSSALELNWRLNEVKEVRNIYVFRSEHKMNGYSRLTELTAAEEKWTDKFISPGKKYFYIIQANAINGKRFRQSDTMEVQVPGFFKNVSECNHPVILHASKVKKGFRLLVEISEKEPAEVHVYRGKQNSPPTLLQTIISKGAGVIEIMDPVAQGTDAKSFSYYASYKCRQNSKAIMSAQKTIELTKPDEITYFEAYQNQFGTSLYWDDAVVLSKKYASYQLAGHNGGPTSRSPLMILAEKLSASSFLDTSLANGNEYTYILKMVDKTGQLSEKSWQVVVRK